MPEFMQGPDINGSAVEPNEYAGLGQHSPEAKEMMVWAVPEALILDFDRTLGDVDAAMARLFMAAENAGVDTGQIRAAQARVEADGGSFDPLTYVKGALDEAAYAEFCEQFVAANEPPILYEDASEFLDMLQERDVPHVILTYGANPEWQSLKLRASGYEAGRMIMPHSDKGQEMVNLKGADGMYDFGADDGSSYRAETLMLIDDKAKSFASLPDDCSGILLQRGEALLSQQGEVPAQVRTVNSLRELTVDDAGRVVIERPKLRSMPTAAPEHKKYIPLTADRELHQGWAA
ncbi:MAG: hypothetical protein NVSMB39_2690 [Candidatus Saccharimonadales bacterium]